MKDEIEVLRAHIRENDIKAELDMRLADMQAETDAMRAKAEAYRAAAQDVETLRSEKERLSVDNNLLERRLQELEKHLLVDKAFLGHANSKQKIQYHTRVKQELEEMRHECTGLLRERFRLEQCIRWLSNICTPMDVDFLVFASFRSP